MQAKVSGRPLCQVIGASGQILQVLLLPQQEIYVDAVEVLYGSETLYLKARDLHVARLLGWPRSNQLRRIRNQSESPEYIGIKKGRGKVLCLELSLYQDMMVHSGHVLALNYETDQK